MINLREKISIEVAALTNDSFGEADEAWTEHAAPWAKVSPLSGTEAYQAAQYFSRQVTEFTIRYDSTITTAMRINYESRIYDIQSVINSRYGDQYLVLIGLERDA